MPLGGILITSKRTVHQATLFGFDDGPHAAKLFGGSVVTLSMICKRRANQSLTRTELVYYRIIG